jgi:hypothetical protein
MDIILFLFAAYGLTFTVRSSKLFENPRAWVCSKSTFFLELLSCPFCTGFHAGYLIFLGYHLSFHPVSFSILPLMLVHGFAGAAFSYFLDTHIVRMEGSPL